MQLTANARKKGALAGTSLPVFELARCGAGQLGAFVGFWFEVGRLGKEAMEPEGGLGGEDLLAADNQRAREGRLAGILLPLFELALHGGGRGWIVWQASSSKSESWARKWS